MRRDGENLAEAVELYMTYGDGVHPITVMSEPYKGGYAAYLIGPDAEGNVRELQRHHLDGNGNFLDAGKRRP